MTFSLKPTPGDIIEFIDQKKFITAVCLKSRDKRSEILTETSRTLNLPNSRFLYLTTNKLDVSLPNQQLIARLKDISSRRSIIAEQINLKHLWDEVVEKSISMDVFELVPFIQDMDDVHADDIAASIVRRTFTDRCYFKLIDGRLFVLSEEDVRQVVEKIRQEQRQELIMDGLAQWLECRLKGAAVPENEFISKREIDRLIDALEVDAAGAQEKPDRQWLKNVLGRVDKSLQSVSYEILVKIGHFSPNENLYITRFRYPRTFAPETLDELRELTASNLGNESNRRDLTYLDCFTVDGATTTDMDDALSYEPLNDGGFILGIHITDVSAWIQPGTFLDGEALDRGLTLYLPDKTWHMFPSEFSELTASLQESITLPAISTLVRVSSSLRIESSEIVCSTIKVKQRLTYDDVHMKTAPNIFNLLVDFASRLRSRRVDNGAVLMPRPEISIDATNSPRLLLKKRLRQARSQLIVSEFMILANQLAAGLAAEAGLPFPFRAQKKPDEAVPSSDQFNPYVSYCQRRMMPRAYNSLKAKSHYSLGLSSYTNVTSPLRRYFDVIAQRQLKAIIADDEPYSLEELETVMADLEVSTSRSGSIIFHSNKFWMLKYLTAFKGKTLDAIVLDKFASRYQIWLDSFYMDADLPLSFGKKLVPEQKIQVIVEKVSPRDEKLQLRLL